MKQYYQCPECDYNNEKWGLFKGHLIKSHGRNDMKDAKATDFTEFLITGSDEKKRSVSGSVNSTISAYSDEPSERLREVLEVNLPESPEIINKVCRVFLLSPWLEQDLPGLERMLTAHFGTGKKLLIQNCLSQYSRTPYSNNQADELGGSGGMMIIPDANGNPMKLPADKGLIEALRNKTVAETEILKFQQMQQLMGGNGNQQIAELQKKFDDLVKTLTDQKIARLEERVKNAEDLALHPTDGKGVLDVVSEAGADLREGAAEAGKELKSAVTDGFATLAKLFSKNAVETIAQPFVAKSPQRIAMILSAENDYMRVIHEPGY